MVIGRQALHGLALFACRHANGAAHLPGLLGTVLRHIGAHRGARHARGAVPYSDTTAPGSASLQQMQQCLSEVSGVGGNCSPSPYYEPPRQQYRQSYPY
jgi:hypothetical protein